MRSFDPKDKYDQETAKRLGAEQWMLDLLKLNPSYTCWGPYEDYMSDKSGGWKDPQIIKSWSEFDWKLDEYNECVNFYFQIRRDEKDCTCGGGYNPATSRIADDFFDYSSSTGKGWHDQITQDEADALVAAGRCAKYDSDTKKWVSVPRTAAEVNAAQKNLFTEDLYSHDGINRGILIETRAKRLGVWGLCKKCDGHGSVFTESEAHASVVFWILHPRKGCSRGVEVQQIERKQLPKVFAFIREAAKRNAERFAKVVKLYGSRRGRR